MDQIIKLEDHVKSYFKIGQTLIAVFLKHEHAFDLCWSEAVVSKLNRMHVGCKTFRYVSNFLQERKMTVRVNNETPEYYTLEN